MAAVVSRLGHLGCHRSSFKDSCTSVWAAPDRRSHSCSVLCKLIQLSPFFFSSIFIPVSFYQFSVALFSVAVFPFFLSLYRKAVLDPRHCAVQFKPHLSVRIFSCQFRQYFAHQFKTSSFASRAFTQIAPSRVSAYGFPLNATAVRGSPSSPVRLMLRSHPFRGPHGGQDILLCLCKRRLFFPDQGKG